MIDLLKNEIDELDQVNWFEGPEYYKYKHFNPDKKPTEDPDKELETIKKLIDAGLIREQNFTTPEQSSRNQMSFSPIAFSNRISYPRTFLEDLTYRIACVLKKHYNAEVVRCRGIFYYPPYAECYWHTNSDVPGKRVYLTWAEDDDKSFFKYYDNTTEKIVTKYDKKGWNINEFDIPEEGYFWHYIATKDTKRKSLGFIIIPKTRDIHTPESHTIPGAPINRPYRIVLKGEDKNQVLPQHEVYRRIILADTDYAAKLKARQIFPSDEFDLYKINTVKTTSEELVSTN